jgi:hypothetical protein
MPIPEERLPEVDESYVEQPSNEPNDLVDSVADEDALEFESSAADESDDDDLDNDETTDAEADTAGFGFGDPAE